MRLRVVLHVTQTQCEQAEVHLPGSGHSQIDCPTACADPETFGGVA